VGQLFGGELSAKINDGSNSDQLDCRVLLEPKNISIHILSLNGEESLADSQAKSKGTMVVKLALGGQLRSELPLALGVASLVTTTQL